MATWFRSNSRGSLRSIDGVVLKISCGASQLTRATGRKRFACAAVTGGGISDNLIRMLRFLRLKMKLPSFFSILLLVCVGCGPTGPTMYTISGSVKLGGQPVEQGTITLEDQTAGYAATTDIQSGGNYSVKLPAGSYRVMLLPLTEEIVSAEGMAETVLVNPKSIPLKYQSPERSGLKVEVSDNTPFDIDLTPQSAGKK